MRRTVIIVGLLDAGRLWQTCRDSPVSLLTTLNLYVCYALGCGFVIEQSHTRFFNHRGTTGRVRNLESTVAFTLLTLLCFVLFVCHLNNSRGC